MKRISTFVALLVLLCGVSQARHSQRYRMQYSPYAFSYRNNGLVPGGMRYSMYAFNYRNSGLIDEYLTGGTGLVVRCGAPAMASLRSRPARSTTRSSSSARCSISGQELKRIEERDGLHVIRRYLADQGFKDIRVKHHLSIENQTVAAAFILAEENLIITYRNPEALASLAQDTGYKKKVMEKVEQDLESTSTAFLAKGGQIHGIDASDKSQIIVALQDCAELRSYPMVPGPTAMYAKN